MFSIPSAVQGIKAKLSTCKISTQLAKVSLYPQIKLIFILNICWVDLKGQIKLKNILDFHHPLPTQLHWFLFLFLNSCSQYIFMWRMIVFTFPRLSFHNGYDFIFSLESPYKGQLYLEFIIYTSPLPCAESYVLSLYLSIWCQKSLTQHRASPFHPKTMALVLKMLISESHIL